MLKSLKDETLKGWNIDKMKRAENTERMEHRRDEKS